MWWNSVVKLWEYQCRSVFRWHRKAEDGVDRDSSAKGERESDGGTGLVLVRCTVMEDGREIAMGGGVEVKRVANGAAKFDWFERVASIKSDVFSDKVWSFGHNPLVKE
jgi:hypothetical protein